MQQVVDRLQVGVYGQADIGHDVFPGDGRCVISPEMFHRADLDAEHDVADAVLPVVERLFDGADAQHDVVVHRPVAARLQLLDIVVEAGAAHLVAHALGVDVLVVEIEDDLVLAPFQQVFQARNLVGGDVAVAVYEAELLQLFVGIVGHTPLAGGRAVDRQVVHQYHDAVAGEAEVDLEEGRHHRQRLFARFDAVFGIAGHHAPAVSADDDVTAGVIGEIGLQFFDRPDPHGVRYRGLGARGQHGGAAYG